MEQGEELVLSIEANDFLDAVVCENEDIDEWLEADSTEERQLPDNYWCRTGVMETEYRFVAPEEGRYVLLVVNWDEEATEVTVDAAVWEGEE
jgi:hypothetical protein